MLSLCDSGNVDERIILVVHIKHMAVLHCMQFLPALEYPHSARHAVKQHALCVIVAAFSAMCTS